MARNLRSRGYAPYPYDTTSRSFRAGAWKNWGEERPSPNPFRLASLANNRLLRIDRETLARRPFRNHQFTEEYYGG